MVLDVMMPRMDGYGVLRVMRQQELAPQTKVLVLTCKTEERDFMRGWELGADDYRTKPFEPEELVEHLQDLLRTSADVLHGRRQAELEKAELLDRLESACSRPTRGWRADPPRLKKIGHRALIGISTPLGRVLKV